MVGRVDEGRARIAEALRRAERLAHVPSEVLALFFKMLMTRGYDDHEETKLVSGRCLDLSIANGFPYYVPAAMIVSGSTQAAVGDAAAGLESIEQGMALMDFAGARLGRPLYLAYRAMACEATGDVDAGLRHVEDGLACAEQTGERAGVPELLCARGDLHAQLGDGEAAEESFRRAVDVAKETQASRKRLAIDRPSLATVDLTRRRRIRPSRPPPAPSADAARDRTPTRQRGERAPGDGRLSAPPAESGESGL